MSNNTAQLIGTVILICGVWSIVLSVGVRVNKSSRYAFAACGGILLSLFSMLVIK